MLEIKNIKKSYKTGDFVQTALNNVSIKFKEKEFVSILGTSGSGKTTLLNLIGGLDSFDSGDLIIDGVSTKNYKEKDWDYYRNNSIGFIFQSYNLISHISILANVELGMTLSGVSSKERKRRALEVLEKVGLKDHCHKKPNQLSGGQMQRVAIARAIVNDPKIILADEPTGALDTKTSKEILDIIKEISKDKLVIMVTHNASLAEEYSNRIVRLKDGEIISDNNEVNQISEAKESYNVNKTAMNFFTALGLSLTNIFTKKGRTILTAFAASIGIIGISIILALSNGFDIQINNFEKESLSSFPISINKVTYEDMDFEKMQEISESETSSKFDENKIYEFDYEESRLIHNNNFDDDYLEYISKINKDLVSGISYDRNISMNFVSYFDNEYNYFDNSLGFFKSLPIDYANNNYLNENYELLSGDFSSNYDELLIEVDSNNRVDENILGYFGITSEDELESLIGKEIKMIFNNQYYLSSNNIFVLNNDYESMYNNENSLTLKITGIVKAKEDTDQETPMVEYQSLVGSVLYKDELFDFVLDKNNNSQIVLEQNEKDYNVFNGLKFKDNEKEAMLTYLGGNIKPDSISIYPKDFDSKEKIISYLDEYNEDLSSDDKIIYTDLAKTMISLTGNIMDGITTVLVAFSSISLVVSGIMIGIITYISVLERTKEIGVLRALGARKKDISRVFNAETFIIGLTSGIMGVGIAWLLIFPINILLENMTELENVAQMNVGSVLLMIILSVLITLIGGVIPAKIASKKDPVEALRSE